MPSSTFRVLSTAALAAAMFVPSAQAVRAQSTTTPAAASPDVTVIDAGAAPRRALRYTLVKGATESMTMRQQMSMTMEVGGMALPSQSLPITVMTSTYAVTDVASDGTAAISGEFVGVDVEAGATDAMLVDAMRSQLAAMNGLTMTYKVSPTGQVSKMEFGAGAPAALQSLGSIEQMSVALPTEPVGVGARWKASRQAKQSGITVMQDVDYVVKSLGADSIVLEVVTAQSAKDQVMDAGTLPGGATAMLRTLEGKGTSTMMIHFNRVQPVLDMKMNVGMTIEVNVGGDVNTMNQTVVMEIKTAPSPKP